MIAECSPSWTSWTIKTYFSFKLFSFVPESKLYTISLLFFYKKNLWWRFRGLLIHSLVTPDHKNMEKSSLNFGDQPLKIEIEQNFYLSGQNRYLINSLNKASSVSNCCELKRDIFFLNSAPFQCYIVWLHSE